MKMHFGPGAEKVLKRYEKEIATYLRELPRLLEESNEDRYALIKGDEIHSVWDTEADATQAGGEKFGAEQIFVTRIDERDRKRYAQLFATIKQRREQLAAIQATASHPAPKVYLDEKGEKIIDMYEKEIATYVRELPRLLEEGEAERYALIKGDEILSIWDTDGDAIQAGREKFGLEPICVQKIRVRDLQIYEQLLNLRKGASCPS